MSFNMEELNFARQQYIRLQKLETEENIIKEKKRILQVMEKEISSNKNKCLENLKKNYIEGGYLSSCSCLGTIKSENPKIIEPYLKEIYPDIEFKRKIVRYSGEFDLFHDTKIGYDLTKYVQKQ